MIYASRVSPFEACSQTSLVWALYSCLFLIHRTIFSNLQEPIAIAIAQQFYLLHWYYYNCFILKPFFWFLQYGWFGCIVCGAEYVSWICCRCSPPGPISNKVANLFVIDSTSISNRFKPRKGCESLGNPKKKTFLGRNLVLLSQSVTCYCILAGRESVSCLQGDGNCLFFWYRGLHRDKVSISFQSKGHILHYDWDWDCDEMKSKTGFFQILHSCLWSSAVWNTISFSITRRLSLKDSMYFVLQLHLVGRESVRHAG